jgi:hypothetical protein
VTITSSATIVGSPVSLTGTGFTPTLPTLSVLDNFNRANAVNLGTNWLQGTLLGAAAITINNNQALDPLVAGSAFWNAATFGAKQAAAFTIAGTTLNNDALLLAATGTPNGGNVLPNFVRVLYNGGAVTVATTVNNGANYTTAGTITGTFANGNTITAVLDGSNAVTAPTVYVFNGSTFVGAVQIAPDALWQSGGKIGIQMPVSLTQARIDNFAGGTLP